MYVVCSMYTCICTPGEEKVIIYYMYDLFAAGLKSHAYYRCTQVYTHTHTGIKS